VDWGGPREPCEGEILRAKRLVQDMPRHVRQLIYTKDCKWWEWYWNGKDNGGNRTGLVSHAGLMQDTNEHA